MIFHLKMLTYILTLVLEIKTDRHEEATNSCQ